MRLMPMNYVKQRRAMQGFISYRRKLLEWVEGYPVTDMSTMNS
jgi:hypothetical protein